MQGLPPGDGHCNHTDNRVKLLNPDHRLDLLSDKSSAAVSRTFRVTVSPPSILAISASRPILVRLLTEVMVRLRSCPFCTTRWWSAWDATCGKCVMQNTWWNMPNLLNLVPNAAATAPPTPESTSSKTKIGT